jgi:hypothetical protein
MWHWLTRGFGHVDLGPSPRLRRMREEQEAAMRSARPGEPLPPLPDSAYPPGAVPPGTSGIPTPPPRRHL